MFIPANEWLCSLCAAAHTVASDSDTQGGVVSKQHRAPADDSLHNALTGKLQYVGKILTCLSRVVGGLFSALPGNSMLCSQHVRKDTDEDQRNTNDEIRESLQQEDF